MGASYKATAINTKCGSIECEGPLFYSNLMEFGPKVKELSWRIVDLQGK